MAQTRNHLCALLAVVLSPCCVLDVQAVEDGLFGHWIFDATHISGNIVKGLAGNHDATIEGPVQLLDPAGMGGLILDGTSSFVVCDDVSPSELPQRELTLEAWFCPFSSGNWEGIVSYANDTLSATGAYKLEGWSLGTFGLRNVYLLSTNNSVTEDRPLPHLARRYTELRQWSHIVATYDGFVQKIYVDGQFDSSFMPTEGNIVYPVSAALLMGGHRDHDDTMPGNGILQEVRIYSRVLQNDEILRHYESKADILPTPPPHLP